MRAIVVAIAFFLLLSWPLARIADRPVLVLGVPLLYLYILVVWALVILLYALAVRRPRKQRKPRG